ncbi:MAG: hypothetical protein OXG11_02990, partial [Chloroflexi bacterium]|nr:hypothetical protein [Chloroflexota bacterium]
LGDDLREGLTVLDVDVPDAGLHHIIDLEEHSGHPHVLGLALGLAEQARTDATLRRNLMPEALAALDTDSEDPDLDAYLAELVSDMEMLAAEALLREDRL